MSDPLDMLPTDPAAAGGLDASTTTFPSDSENYHSEEHSPSPPSSASPLILYSPPTFWGLIRGAAINLLLPFVNGLMLGFGELVANEAAYRLGWSGTKVRAAVYDVCWNENPWLLTVCRSSPLDEQTRDAWAPVWRCAPTPSRGGGGTDRSSTCTLPWSRAAVCVCVGGVNDTYVRTNERTSETASAAHLRSRHVNACWLYFKIQCYTKHNN